MPEQLRQIQHRQRVQIRFVSRKDKHGYTTLKLWQYTYILQKRKNIDKPQKIIAVQSRR